MSVGQRNEWVLAAVDRYEGRLVRYTSRLLGDEDAARDAVQHAFLQLCDDSRVQSPDHLAAWLYTVCRNKALDWLRKSGRHEPLNGRASAQLAAREQDPAAAAERSDLHESLRRLVDQLPASQREVIDLWLDGLSYGEIAAITDRSEGAIRVTAHRALTRLRRQARVRELLYGEPPGTHTSPTSMRASR